MDRHEQDMQALEDRIERRAHRQRVLWVAVVLGSGALSLYGMWRLALWVVVTLQSRLQWL